jgi:hypothetical protein
MTLFTVGDVVNHRVGDRHCPECAEEYPEACRCGGLVHAADAGEPDVEGNPVLVTLCDTCGRSEDQLDEAV